MIVPFIIWALTHPNTQDFCTRHLVDWDRSDPQTREYLERLEREEQEEDEP